MGIMIFEPRSDKFDKILGAFNTRVIVQLLALKPKSTFFITVRHGIKQES